MITTVNKGHIHTYANNLTMKASVGESILVPMQVIHARLEGGAQLSKNTDEHTLRVRNSCYIPKHHVHSLYAPIHSVYTYCTITIKHIKYNLVYVMYSLCLCSSVTK